MPVNPILYVIAALILIIAGLGVWLYIDGVRLTAANTTITALQSENQDWAAKTKLANDNFSKIKADDDAMRARAVAAEAKADQQNAAQIALAAKLRAIKAAPDDCKAATALVNRYLSGK